MVMPTSAISVSAAPTSVWDQCVCGKALFDGVEADQLEIQLWHKVPVAQTTAAVPGFLDRVGMKGGAFALFTVRSYIREPDVNRHVGQALVRVLGERYEVVADYSWDDRAYIVHASRDPRYAVYTSLDPGKLKPHPGNGF